MKTQINIGLATNDKRGITPNDVMEEFDRLGIHVLFAEVAQSNTEPTFVGMISRPMTALEAFNLSVNLRQEAIVQVAGDVGELYGPSADAWKPFNPEFFIESADDIETQEVRSCEWAMIRPISKIQQEVFPQRVQVHHATTSYGGSIEKPVRDY